MEFKATKATAYSLSPPARLIQTMTIAIQGAMPMRISPPEVVRIVAHKDARESEHHEGCDNPVEHKP
jgi:hypothetical protein